MIKSLALLIIITLCLLGCIGVSLAQDWQELKGDHFLVYFTKDEKFAKEVLDKAEVYYDRIASDLGYSRYSGFWTWDNRVKIYIYPDRNSYSKVSNVASWSEGMADYKNKRIISYAWGKGFLDSLLPHEMAHLIFRDFVGFKGEVPVWIDEGVAQWEEPFKREKVKTASKYLLTNSMLFSVTDMVNLDIRKVSENSKVSIHSICDKNGNRNFLSLNGNVVVNTYYIEAVSIVGFLIKHYGADNFTNFCRQLRDGKSLEESLSFAYPTNIITIEELENSWLEYLVQEE